MPDIDANASVIASGAGSTAAASSVAQAEQMESFSSSASFKYRGLIMQEIPLAVHVVTITPNHRSSIMDLAPTKAHFPILAADSEPLTILPGFLEVLGRKIDSCNDVLESRIELSMCG